MITDLKDAIENQLSELTGVSLREFDRKLLDSAGDSLPGNIVAYQVTKDHTRLTIELAKVEGSEPQLRSIRISELGENGKEVSAREFRSNGHSLSNDQCHSLTLTALKALDDAGDAIAELTQTFSQIPDNRFSNYQKLPHFNQEVAALYGDLITAWSDRGRINPVQVRDTLALGFSRTRYLSDSGLAEVRKNLGNELLIGFADKDNAGVLNDVGLNDLVDYLISMEYEAFYGKVGEQAAATKVIGELGRFAGDEFLVVVPKGEDGIRTIKEYQSRQNLIRDEVFEGTTLPPELKQRYTDIKERLEVAQKLAELKKGMEGIRALYRFDQGDIEKVGVEDFGRWLHLNVGPSLFKSWAEHTTGRALTTFSDVEKESEIALPVLVHGLQAYTTHYILDKLRSGSDLTDSGIDQRVIDSIKRVRDETKVMGTSLAIVNLSSRGTPYDMARAIAVAEKAIYRQKWVGVELQDQPLEVDPTIRIKQSEKIEIQKLDTLVRNYNDIDGLLQDHALSEDQRSAFILEAFRLSCIDPGSERVLRLSQVGNFKARTVLPIEETAYYTGIRFHIEGFGAFNKGEGMPYANDIFVAVMNRFSAEFPDSQLELRSGGGTGEVYLKDQAPISRDKRNALEAILTAIVQDKITKYTELTFYEKQAYRLFATRYADEYPYFTDRLKEATDLGHVRIEQGGASVDGNQKIEIMQRTIFRQK